MSEAREFASRSRMKLEEQFGVPDLRLGPLSIWVHGRQFEALHDFWDGNWLRVTAHCGAGEPEVTISGTFVRITELLAWARECEVLLDGGRDTAELPTLEPNLMIDMTTDHLGHIETKVEISPDDDMQEHVFRFGIDRAYLSSLLSDIRRIATEFPERGAAR